MTTTFCSACGQALKEGARFCANCGATVVAKPEPAQKPVAPVVTPAVVAPTPVTQSPASPPQFSTDGKHWWDGTKWNVVPTAPASPVLPRPPATLAPPPSVISAAPSSPHKPNHLPRNLAIGFGIALLVLVGILWATGEFSPVSNTTNNTTNPTISKADSGLGTGPIYWHFNCNQDANCMTYGHNELTAAGSNTGIFQDWPDLVSCKQELAAYPTLFPKQWCSTSKKPADTGP